MAPPFKKSEYETRAQKVQSELKRRGLDALFITDASNINWLCGYDAWSFYIPQAVLLEADGSPVWIGRDMDAGAAKFTTYLDEQNIVPVPESYVQRADVHFGKFMAEQLVDRGLKGKRIGYESDGYLLSPKWLDELKYVLGEQAFVDADLLVNWCRCQKSPAEIEVMQTAADIAGMTMQTALKKAKPGVKQADVMADAIAQQVRGTGEACGHLTGLYPLVLAGEKATTAHPMWDDSVFESDQTIAFELGGNRHRYNAGLARTVHLGKPPQKLLDTSQAVEEGMEALLDTLRAGITCHDAHASWQRVLDKYGLEKNSRIGYSIGVGYAPDWGERTLSLRPGDQVVIPENAVVHVILGMWMDDWGMELSETIHIQESGCQCLTHFPRNVHVVD